MNVIALAQRKGGCMKSTLAIHIAAAAADDGKQAVVIELDKQGTASLWNDKRRNDQHPKVMRIESNALDQTLAVLKNLGVTLVVLDLPGTHNPAIAAAIKATDTVLIPARPSEVDISHSAETLETVHRLRKPYAFVMTFVEGTGKRADEARDALVAEGHPVVPQYMGRRQVYQDAIATGRTVMEIDPASKASEEIVGLWAWVVSQLENTSAEQPLPNGSNQLAETRH